MPSRRHANIRAPNPSGIVSHRTGHPRSGRMPGVRPQRTPDVSPHPFSSRPTTAAADSDAHDRGDPRPPSPTAAAGESPWRETSPARSRSGTPGPSRTGGPGEGDDRPRASPLPTRAPGRARPSDASTRWRLRVSRCRGRPAGVRLDDVGGSGLDGDREVRQSGPIRSDQTSADESTTWIELPRYFDSTSSTSSALNAWRSLAMALRSASW